jgi:hypothetical protein
MAKGPKRRKIIEIILIPIQNVEMYRKANYKTVTNINGRRLGLFTGQTHPSTVPLTVDLHHASLT